MTLPTPAVRLRNSYAGYWLDLWKYLVSLIAALNINSPPTYRAVITTIAAYTGTLTGTLTGSAVGAIGAQDSTVTLAVGDRVILPVVTGGAGGATVAADSGPYLVVNPGSAGAKFVLTRPPEFAQGSTIGECVTFKIGEGTIWAGNEWRAFPATATKIVGTDDPHFWPRTFSELITLSGGTATVSNFWIKDINKVAGTNTAAAAAFNFAITAGAGTGAITATGTGSNTIATFAVNF